MRATRIKAGRTETPSYAIIDSQSVKTIGANEERGIDGGKKLRDETTGAMDRRTHLGMA